MNTKKFSKYIVNISPENSLPRNCQKTEKISLSNDVNDHVCSKSKSTWLRTDL